MHNKRIFNNSLRCPRYHDFRDTPILTHFSGILFGVADCRLSRAVARFMFSARFRPERKQAKIFAAFLLCTPISLISTLFCYENRSDHEGQGKHRRKPAEISACFISITRLARNLNRATALRLSEFAPTPLLFLLFLMYQVPSVSIYKALIHRK
jgi:hypothetical protein